MHVRDDLRLDPVSIDLLSEISSTHPAMAPTASSFTTRRYNSRSYPTRTFRHRVNLTQARRRRVVTDGLFSMVHANKG
jgi:hypothetical protein